MVRAGRTSIANRASNLTSGISTAKTNTTAHIIRCSLMFLQVDRTKCVDSYFSCFVMAALSSFMSTVFLITYVIAGIGLSFLKNGSNLMILGLVFLFFTLFMMAGCYLISWGNCSMLGIQHSVLEFNIILGLVSYIPLLVVSGFLGSLALSITGIVYLFLNIFYIRTNYSHVTLEGERESTFYYVYIFICVIVASTLFPKVPMMVLSELALRK